MQTAYHRSLRKNAEAVLRLGKFQDVQSSENSLELVAGIFLSDRPYCLPDEQEEHVWLAVSFGLTEGELQQWEVKGETQSFRQWCIPAVVLNSRCVIEGILPNRGTSGAHDLHPEDIDFNSKYHLLPDPVLPTSDLLRIHPTTAGFVSADTGQPPSLEDVQAMLSTMLLIPNVPEDVRRTFNIAKRLHLFGYLEYSFFTVSQHYAYLALEAAVYTRWIMTLPKPTPVEVPPHPPHTLHSPKHEDLFRLWTSAKRQLKVNGQPFPNTVEKVLGRLEASGIVRAAERKRMTAAMHLRNDLSHLESPTIMPPQPAILRIIAAFINVIFDRHGT